MGTDRSDLERWAQTRVLGGVGLENIVDIGVGDGGQSLKRPVFADLRKPTYAAGLCRGLI